MGGPVQGSGRHKDEDLHEVPKGGHVPGTVIVFVCYVITWFKVAPLIHKHSPDKL